MKKLALICGLVVGGVACGDTDKETTTSLETAVLVNEAEVKNCAPRVVTACCASAEHGGCWHTCRYEYECCSAMGMPLQCRDL